jgi:threonine dehydrogenase-like Zn-dependent dehydrogenase
MFERAQGFRPGHYVDVYGAGPIGLAAIGLAKAAGAGTIVAFEISPERLELARAVGADYAYDPREVSPGEVMMELSKGEGFDFHVEAAGVPELAIPEMEKALAINAKIVQIGRAAQRVPMYLTGFWRPGTLGSRDLSQCHPNGGFWPARSQPDHHCQIQPGASGGSDRQVHQAG